MVTFSGVTFRSIACSKSLCAAALSRCARSKKSTVSPALSTARYRYFYSPLTLMYASSMRQLLPTLSLEHRNFFSRTGNELIAQRCTVE